MTAAPSLFRTASMAAMGLSTCILMVPVMCSSASGFDSKGLSFVEMLIMGSAASCSQAGRSPSSSARERWTASTSGDVKSRVFSRICGTCLRNTMTQSSSSMIRAWHRSVPLCPSVTEKVTRGCCAAKAAAVRSSFRCTRGKAPMRRGSR